MGDESGLRRADVVALSRQQNEFALQVDRRINEINQAVQELSNEARINMSESSDLSQFSLMLKSSVAGLTEEVDLPEEDNTTFF